MKIPLCRNDQHGAVIGFSHQKPTTSVVGGFTNLIQTMSEERRGYPSEQAFLDIGELMRIPALYGLAVQCHPIEALRDFMLCYDLIDENAPDVANAQTMVEIRNIEQVNSISEELLESDPAYPRALVEPFLVVLWFTKQHDSSIQETIKYLESHCGWEVLACYGRMMGNNDPVENLYILEGHMRKIESGKELRIID